MYSIGFEIVNTVKKRKKKKKKMSSEEEMDYEIGGGVQSRKRKRRRTSKKRKARKKRTRKRKSTKRRKSKRPTRRKPKRPKRKKPKVKPVDLEVEQVPVFDEDPVMVEMGPGGVADMEPFPIELPGDQPSIESVVDDMPENVDPFQPDGNADPFQPDDPMTSTIPVDQGMNPTEPAADPHDENDIPEVDVPPVIPSIPWDDPETRLERALNRIDNILNGPKSRRNRTIIVLTLALAVYLKFVTFKLAKSFIEDYRREGRRLNPENYKLIQRAMLAVLRYAEGQMNKETGIGRLCKQLIELVIGRVDNMRQERTTWETVKEVGGGALRAIISVFGAMFKKERDPYQPAGPVALSPEIRGDPGRGPGPPPPLDPSE